MLPPAALLNRLDRSLKLLVGGAADLPTRQQTLRGAIDWSYQLLRPEEQILFCRLGVFVGGFTLESAEVICNPDGELDIFSGFEALLHNSLLRPVKWDFDEPRFDILQTIRDFALESLAAAGELANMQAGHGEYFAQEVMTNWMQMMGEQSLLRLDMLEIEHDNYRAAIAWGLEPGHDISIASRICVFQTWFWYRRGHFHEGREWSERAARATEGSEGIWRAMSLLAAGFMQMWQGDLALAAQNAEKSLRHFEKAGFEIGLTLAHLSYGIILINQGLDREAYGHITLAVEMFDQSGDLWNKSTALIHLANVSLGLGQYDQALNWLRTARPIAESLGDPWLLAFNLNNFGEVARTQEDYELARTYYKRSEALFREADAVGDLARSVHTRGYLALHEGDGSRAEALFHESLTIFRRLGNKRGMAECLAGLAAVGVGDVRASWAAVLLSAAEAQIAASGAAWWPADRVEIERTKRQLAETLGEAEFDRLKVQGQGMDLAEALELAGGER
jgi:tetratricopeptide (TPR) repeat protein